MAWDRNQHLCFDLSELISVAIPEDRDAGQLAENAPGLFIMVGLMLRCRRLLIGIQALLDADALDTSRHLSREVLEITATALWLMEDPRERVEVFMGDARRHLQYLAAKVPPEGERVILFDRLMKSIVGRAINHRMPRLKDRSFMKWPEMQGMHRHMSEGVHVNFHTSQYGVSLEEDTLLFIDEPQDHDMDFEFARYALLLACYLTRRVHQLLDWGHLELFDELIEHWGGFEPNSPDDPFTAWDSS